MCENELGLAHGNTVLELDDKIKTNSDIIELSKRIENNGSLKKVTIIGLILL
jgi:hypothetical protein